MKKVAILIFFLLIPQTLLANLLKGNFTNFLDFKTYYTNQKEGFIEGALGTKLEKGLNFYFIAGAKGRTKHLEVCVSARGKGLHFPEEKKFETELFTTYLKLYFYKFSFEVGKDSVQYEPGEYGLLFSHNAPPYWMVKFQTEKPLIFWGKWNFAIFQGWLREKRRDYSNPKVLGIRLSWRPFSWLEIGGTRSTLFGGDGRPSYKIWDYWEIITAAKENEPGNKFDNDGYADYDFSVYIPAKNWISSIEELKLYYEQGGTDLCAFWQPEDSYSKCGIFGFALMDTATVAGIYLKTKKQSLRFEYAETSKDWYIHHIYNYEGYTYHGFSLGYPYGRDIQSFLFKHEFKLNPRWKILYKLGYYRSPYKKLGPSMKRYYQEFRLKYSKPNWYIEGFLRFDETKNYDTNFLPNHFNVISENKFFYTLGIFFNYKFEFDYLGEK